MYRPGPTTLTPHTTASPTTARKPIAAETRTGIAYGLAAYIAWGLAPIYFKAVAHIPALEVLAHRMLWAVPFLLLLLSFQGRIRMLLPPLRDRKTLITLLASTLLIGSNWGVYIWAIANDQVLQGSLGYFINPLLNVLLGFVFLGERLRRWQTIGIIMAALGVAYLTWTKGTVPVVALFLAFTFAFYGLLRKTAKVDSLVGLSIETTLLLPLAIAYAVVLATRGDGHFAMGSWSDNVLLAAAGIVTAVPLLWFTNAARRLRYTTVGILQYIAPTGQFILGAAVYGEEFGRAEAVCFGLIWIALLIYTADSIRASRQAAKDAAT